MMCSAHPRRLANAAAQSSVCMDVGEPSTPTKTTSGCAIRLILVQTYGQAEVAALLLEVGTVARYAEMQGGLERGIDTRCAAYAPRWGDERANAAGRCR